MDAARPAEPPAEPTRGSAAGGACGAGTTQRIPSAARTEQLPHAETTQQLPASHTEKIPETHSERPTRAIRQVRRRDEDGAWPAIPMFPVIKPEAGPMSDVERVQEQRGMRALREHLDQWQDSDADAPAWPEREDPPGTIYPPEH